MDLRIEARLDRIIATSESILSRLQSDERLSNILPQVRLLAELNENPVETSWLDCEIYGVENLPKSTPRNTDGLLIFMDLHKMPDIAALDIEDIVNKGFDVESRSSYDTVATQSIWQLEERKFQEILKRPDDTLLRRIDFQCEIFDLEAGRVLQNVRSYVHQYVGHIWNKSVVEKENISLLGPDYHIVVDNLDALETGVGQELAAALDNLRSENPANWKLAALSCRNVIIKLGDSLWQVPVDTYDSALDAKQLDLRGDREKNRLYAYIDYSYRDSTDEAVRQTLKQVHDFIWDIYNMGSKAKRAIRHEEATKTVVDTFNLVAELDRVTILKPVSDIN